MSHKDATIAKGLLMLGFMKRLSSEFRDPYTLKLLYVISLRVDQFRHKGFIITTAGGSWFSFSFVSHTTA
jgi:hypothetical protein